MPQIIQYFHAFITPACYYFQVLMGFLGDEMTQSMLPLMINFEAKSISKQFGALRETMEKR